MPAVTEYHEYLHAHYAVSEQPDPQSRFKALKRFVSRCVAHFFRQQNEVNANIVRTLDAMHLDSAAAERHAAAMARQIEEQAAHIQQLQREHETARKTDRELTAAVEIVQRMQNHHGTVLGMIDRRINSSEQMLADMRLQHAHLQQALDATQVTLAAAQIRQEESAHALDAMAQEQQGMARRQDDLTTMLRHAQDELAALLRHAQDELTTMLRHAQDQVQGVSARQDDVVHHMAVLRVAVDGVVRRQDDVVRTAETLDGTMAGLVKRQDDLVQVTQATFAAHNARVNDLAKLQEELAPQLRDLVQHVHATDAERHQVQDATQQRMNDLVRTCETVEHHVTDAIARQNDIVRQLALVTEKAGDVAQRCAALHHDTQGVTRRQDALVSSTEQMMLQLSGALQSSGAVGERIATAEKGFEALRGECEHLREQTGAVRSAVQLLLDALHGPAAARTVARTAVKECALRMSDAVYLAFEDAYRGDEATITQRLERYLALVKHCVTSPRDRILDLGCGRGEFVALLEQHGLLAHGVDSNRHAVARARKHGLAVKHGDLFDELAHARDNSYAAIAAFHVIEHLPFAQTAHLLRLALKKLKPGGVLLLETPNILSLRVAASEFHKDPTHVCPVHPATLEYWLGQTGFTAMAVAFLNPFSSAESSGLPHTQLAPGTHDILRTLDATIFGCRDCSVAAYKPQPKEIKQ